MVVSELKLVNFIKKKEKISILFSAWLTAKGLRLTPSMASIGEPVHPVFTPTIRDEFSIRIWCSEQVMRWKLCASSVHSWALMTVHPHTFPKTQTDASACIPSASSNSPPFPIRQNTMNIDSFPQTAILHTGIDEGVTKAENWGKKN